MQTFKPHHQWPHTMHLPAQLNSQPAGKPASQPPKHPNLTPSRYRTVLNSPRLQVHTNYVRLNCDKSLCCSSTRPAFMCCCSVLAGVQRTPTAIGEHLKGQQHRTVLQCAPRLLGGNHSLLCCLTHSSWQAGRQTCSSSSCRCCCTSTRLGCINQQLKQQVQQQSAPLRALCSRRLFSAPQLVCNLYSCRHNLSSRRVHHASSAH